MQEPLDNSIKHLTEIPHTISFVIRKRIQVDNFNELPQDKRPPEMMIWDGTSKDLDKWLDKVYKRDEPQVTELSLLESEIE